MLRYLTLLCAAVFLTLLIGGRDQGQVRQGLLQEPIHAPLPAEPPRALADAGKLPPPAPDVAMATFVPVATPEPALPAAPPAPVAAAVAPAPAAAAADGGVFSLADTPAAGAAAGPVVGLRWVQASAINVREGPGTGYGVAGRLTRGEAVTVVADAGDGWLRIRIEGDGLEGFVAARLLTETAP
jgi:hypothetical protein